MSSDERKIKRIRRACRNCRRKKVRCSGEQPVCAFCQRLSQSCQYVDRTESDSRASREPNTSNPSNEELGRRIDTINSKLTDMANVIDGLRSALLSSQMPSSSQSTSVRDWEFGQRSPPAEAPDQIAPFPVLPSLETLSSAADVYFEHCHNQPYSLFHEASFRDQIAAGTVPKHLAVAFLATSLRFSTDARYEHNKYEVIAAYANESWKAIILPWNGVDVAAGVSILQAIFLLSVIDYTSGSQAGWIKVGLAIRIAYHSRLMIEPDSSYSPSKQEERRRVFWSFYALDKLISCGRERPPAIRDEDCKLQLPCDESAFQDGRRQLSTPTLDQFAGDNSNYAVLSPGSTFGLLVLMASIFGKCAQYMLQEHKYPKQGSPWDPKSEFSNIYFRLLQMESNFGLGEPLARRLAQDFSSEGVVDQRQAGPLVYAHCLFHLCHILIHHPFLLRQRLAKLDVKAPSSFLNQALNSCKLHAISLTQLIQEVKDTGFICNTSFYGYYNFLPGSIHALFLHSESKATRDAAAKAYDSCMQNLHELSFYWKHASLMAGSLNSFRANSSRFSLLLHSSTQEHGHLSPDDIAMLWNSVDNGSLSTPQQTEIQQGEGLASTFGSPFSNQLFDFPLLDSFPPLEYLSPLRSSATTPMPSNNIQLPRSSGINSKPGAI